MRRRFVAQWCGAAAGNFPLRLSLHDQGHAAVENGDLAFLASDNIRQVFDHLCHMCDCFFQFHHAIIHLTLLICSCLAPNPTIRYTAPRTNTQE